MSAFEVRAAQLDDAVGISKVVESVWATSDVRIERIEQVLRSADHGTLVACVGNQIAGFVDGFVTRAATGMVRWEVDLLAVKPEFQRRGIASELVALSTDHGRQMGAVIARGLVAVDNIASQRSFARCGYDVEGIDRQLIVYSSRSHNANNSVKPNTINQFIMVQTINYTGYWIEGDTKLTTLIQGKDILASSTNDLIGAVMPNDQSTIIQEALRNGYESVGHFQWWLRPIA